MFVIGLTGGIATGKSLVSSYLKEKGAKIIDADVVAREVVEKDKPALQKLVQNFGREILNKDGSLNRKVLGSLVFKDTQKLSKLNKTIHPFIINEIKKKIMKLSKEKYDQIVVLDAALLLETGLEEIVDEVWLVVVDEKTQLQRLLKRDRQLNIEEAKQRIRSQMPMDLKMKKAHRIIDNNGSIKNTLDQVEKMWQNIIINKLSADDKTI